MDCAGESLVLEGLDFLIREREDLERLPGLIDRGVRVLQPVYFSENRMAGSSEVGDDRGWTELGYAFLEVLVERSESTRVALDLAHMNPISISELLDWYETDPTRAERLIPIYSHGAPVHENYQSPRASATRVSRGFAAWEESSASASAHPSTSRRRS